MITGQQTKAVYLANGTQTEFPLPFFFFDQGDVVVSTVDQYGVEAQITTGYAVAGAQDEDGGTVTFAAPPTAGLKLVLRRRTARKQETRYPEGGKFPSRTVETDFDKLVAIAQELTEEVARCVQTPPDDSIDRNELVQELLAARGAAAVSAEEADASAGAAATSAADALGQADRAESEADAAAAAAAQGVADMEAVRAAGLGALAGAAVPVGMELPWFVDPADPTGGLPPGYVLLLGAELSRATYPDLWAFAEGTGRVVSEAAWQSAYAANGGNVGFYSSGNGTTTFRTPRIVVYVRGGEIAESGDYLADAIVTHRHYGGTVTSALSTGSTAFVRGTTAPQDASGYGSSGPYDFGGNFIGASETRPKTVRRTFIVKAFSAAVNTGEVDVEQLASDFAVLAGALSAKCLHSRLPVALAAAQALAANTIVSLTTTATPTGPLGATKPGGTLALTVPASGVYQIVARACVTPGASTSGFYAYIFKNGVQLETSLTTAIASNWTTNVVMWEGTLNAGDVVDVRVQIGVAGQAYNGFGHLAMIRHS
jgi:hypothetical protein